MKKFVFYFSIIFLLFYSCSGDENSSSSVDSGVVTNGGIGGGGDTGDTGGGNDGNTGTGITGSWLIPTAKVRDGGPGKDGIPSIDNPKFQNSTTYNTKYLNDESLVIGVLSGNEVKAYPHFILDWHEIVNDEINGEFIAISYCPLTGTGFSWDRELKGQVTTFGVSGLLYNANLIPYDRLTDSNWSQLKLQCVNGELKSDVPRTFKVVETTWGMWKKLYPQTKVLSANTGFSRSYEFYPYGDYKTINELFLFNVSPLNNALPNKERVFAIINNNKSKVYRFSDFGNGKAIKDSFNGKDYLIVGNAEVISSYELTGEFKSLDYQYDFNDSESFFKDSEGNMYSIFGEVINGPRSGDNLDNHTSVMSYWFAIAAFYPDPEIY